MEPTTCNDAWGDFRRVWSFKYPGRIDGGMIAKPKHARHLARPTKCEDALDAARADLIHVLDALLGFPPRVRRCLRDYPAEGAFPMPAPPRDKDVFTLIDAGFLTGGGITHSLTPLGFLAQTEIWAAERYVAALTYL